MIIENLELYNYRNYSHCNIKFSPFVNILFGDNAQGKTNLLESLFFLSCGKSFRDRRDASMIRFGEKEAFIRGNIEYEDRKVNIEAKLFSDHRKKQILVNGVKLKNQSELSGRFGTVLFCPEDLMIIKDGPSFRRKFFDNSICQLRPKYAKAIIEYSKLLENKIKILKNWHEKPDLLETIDDFSLRMAYFGAVIIRYRAEYIKKLSLISEQIHSDISGKNEKLKLYYKTVSNIEDPFADREMLYKLLCEHYFSHKKAEIESESCLSGVHKDDLIVLINDVEAKTFASQGQTRTAALALKMAERSIFHEDTGEYPVLLLDDVLSELDTKRQDYILNSIDKGQVIITCCDKERLNNIKYGSIYNIENGEII